MDRNLDRALLFLRKLKQSQDQPKESVYWSSKTLKKTPSLQEQINEAVGHGMTLEDLDADYKRLRQQFKTTILEKEKKKAEREAHARAEWSIQKEAFYTICLGGAYGIFGSFRGSMGRSKTGLECAEKLKKMSRETILDAIKRLQNGEVKGYPLQDYEPEYLQQVISYLTNELQSRG